MGQKMLKQILLNFIKVNVRMGMKVRCAMNVQMVMGKAIKILAIHVIRCHLLF